MTLKQKIVLPIMFMIGLFAFLYLHPPETIHAATNVQATIKSNGDLRFTLTAKKASSSQIPHWQTIGFYVTAKTTGKNGKEGTKSSDCQFFNDMPKSWKSERIYKDGTVHTTFTIPKDNFLAMCDKAGVNYDTLTATGGKVYLQGVLQGYKPSTGKNLTERCYTLAQMKNTRYNHRVNGTVFAGIGWSGSCDAGWRERYDIEVAYPEVESPVTINYYQYNKGEWILVASVTNSRDGKIEDITKNVNSASRDYQWQSTDNSAGTILEGNGLGLKGNGTKKANGSYEYDGIYYYGKKAISTSSKALPSRLSKVLPNGSAGTVGDLSKYYLYSTKESKVNAKKTNGARNKASGTKRVSYKGTYATDSGALTDSYLNWLPSARQDFKVLKGGTVINAFYKKQTVTSKSDYSEDTISDSYLSPETASAVIQADDRGNEKFDSVAGIPTSETQYVNVTLNNYLYTYEFKRYHGKKTFKKYINCSHKILDKNNKPTGKYEHAHDSTDVEREYTYWKVTKLRIYSIDSVIVRNYSLPDEGMSLHPSSSYMSPSVTFNDCGGIKKSPSNGWTVDQYVVQNDLLVFNGKVIMNADISKKKTATPTSIPKPGVTGKDVLYKKDNLIDAKKANGTFESTACAIYGSILIVGNPDGDADLQYDISDINDVTIHTPTVCYPSITDAKKYTQLVTPGQGCSHLVLDKTFTLYYPTKGYHSELKGYGDRDYAKYISKREVNFPFDVYMVDSSGNYTYYKENSWITIANDTTTFYLPIWVNESNAVGIDFRSRAINCDANDGLTLNQETANTSNENYVATSTVYAEISGRLYGLNMYDVSDYPIWQQVFRQENSLQLTGTTYKVGMCDENGNSKPGLLLPTINGSHPLIKNMGVLKTGYTSRFTLTTIGNVYHGTDYISIKPRFYYVSEDGNTMEEVDLYYNETINGKYHSLVKVGSLLDATNVKKMTLGNPYTSVPEAELTTKANIAGLSGKDIRSTTYEVYSYGNIKIPSRMSTYVGQNYAPNGQVPSSVDADKVTKSMQKWYFEYSLPSDVHAVTKGFDMTAYSKQHGKIDYSENIWKTNGYILVNFDITTYEAGFEKFTTGTDTGMGWLEGADIFENVTETPLPRLSYVNASNVGDGYCNMMQLEGFQTTRRDNNGNTFHFRYGDVLMYYLDRSAKRDYRSYGTH